MPQVYRAGVHERGTWYETWTDNADCLPAAPFYRNGPTELTFDQCRRQAQIAADHGAVVVVEVGGQVFEASPF